jgi:hypothetical protein
MTENKEYVCAGQLPKYVLDEAMEVVKPYSVSLIYLNKRHGSEQATPIGSGTWVKIDGKTYILTAGHVINNKAYDEADAIGLCYFEYHKGEQRHTIDKRAFSVYSVWNKSEHEKGPDLGLIKIPPNVESWLNAKTILFWNIDKNIDRAEYNANDDIGATATFGFINEFSSLNKINENNYRFTIYHMLFLGNSKINMICEQDGYDYFTDDVKYNSDSKLPQSFGGASGGGIWRIPFFRDEASKLIKCGNPFLLGLAFYQTLPSGGSCKIVYHGWKSIYIKAKELLVECN